MSKRFMARSLLSVCGAAAVIWAVVICLAPGEAVGSISSGGEGAAAGGGGVQSATFFEQFVVAGGVIVWFVLLPMSVVTVYLVALYSLTLRGGRLFPEGSGTAILEAVRRCGGGVRDELAQREDLLSRAVIRAATEGRGDGFRIRNLVFESLEEQGFTLLRKIEWLNLMGSVSPMVGLFGTVFGMIRVFNAIVAAGGQPQPAQLADGIGVALVTTFWGLLIAIPALAIHGVFRNRIEVIISRATAEAENILPELIRCLQEPHVDSRPTRGHSGVKPKIVEVTGDASGKGKETRISSK